MLPALDHTLRFVLSSLGAGRKDSKILEVGAGDGRLAAELATRGHQVTLLDRTLDRLVPEAKKKCRFFQRDYLEKETTEGGPFDAILFTRSLHHMPNLSRALDLAKGQLVDGGTIVLEEFDVAAADRETAAWYYAHDPSNEDPLVRWKKEHKEEPPLHSGQAMRQAIAERFRVVFHETVPYLYRALSNRPGVDPVELFEAEQRAIADRRIRALGLRLVAR